VNESQAGGDLFIVDNSDTEWKVRRYLHEWADIANRMDVATGFFEIGGLLALDGQWQKLDELRILMGDRMAKRTRAALLEGLQRRLDESIETEKEHNDFLTGVEGIVDALRTGKLQARVYAKDKFHAKAYITHGRSDVVGSAALVGSSNLTKPGIVDNVELNIQVRGPEVDLLQQWFEHYWSEAEDVAPDVLQTIERHTRPFTPFEVYAKALQEYFRSYETTVTDWERSRSRMYGVLDQYQREGYHNLVKIARTWRGAFLCDGVGLGKTFVGLMLIERLVEYERKRVALFVPKATREPVWDTSLDRYLPDLAGDFSNFAIFNHTDLLREGEYERRLDKIRDQADVIIIDEAHHFRNRGKKGTSRYWKMREISDNKQIYMLTATPVNNRITDLLHMIELFARDDDAYFAPAPLGIYSLRGHFNKLDRDLEGLIDSVGAPTETNGVEAERVLLDDQLFGSIVVQRSRAYVKRSVEQHAGREVLFPERQAPQVAKYSIRKTYGKLLELLETAFSRKQPLFTLAIYYPLAYYQGGEIGETDLAIESNRQRQVVGLIRTLFLKRFESSPRAFEVSCDRLLVKLLAWLEVHAVDAHDRSRLEKWKVRRGELIGYVQTRQLEFFGGDSEDDDEDLITPELLDDVDELSPRDDYRISDMVDDTLDDLEVLADFLEELRKFQPKDDDKLRALVKLLTKDPDLRAHKVLIFTEYGDTARYLLQQLAAAGISEIDEVDSGSKRSRSEIITRFAPYYNGSSSARLIARDHPETRVLVSTDVLAEGLNLQDATLLINFDLHWNPVRLMQRIGRVDRRLDEEIEEAIVNDHPEFLRARGKVRYWNFLPPEELDGLLQLYARVSHKTLRISKTFGIEGRQLLTPQDDFDALRDFNHSYEGSTTTTEKLHLEYQQLLHDHPGLEDRLNALPLRIFSAKQHPDPKASGVFLCYALPAQAHDADEWTLDAGYTRWLYYDLSKAEILDDTGLIIETIRSTPDTPMARSLNQAQLSEIRATIDEYLKNSYLKRVGAPIGVAPVLKAWMELC
jgi:superfamily II DNA or RNA helicase